jgi:gluconokinase
MKDAEANCAPALVVIMGVSGSGKSSVAKSVAANCNMEFIEADDLHSMDAKASMASGIPLTDELREPWISSICTFIKTLTKQQQSCVLACSGLKSAHRQRFRALGVPVRFLFLDGDEEVIKSRLGNREDHFFPTKLLKSQFESLERPQNEQDVININIDQSLSAVQTQAIVNVTEFRETIQS